MDNWVGNYRKSLVDYEKEASQYKYLVTMKINLLKIMIVVQATLNLFVLIYGSITQFNIYALSGQLFMLLITAIFALLLKKQVHVSKIVVAMTVFYITTIMPATWIALGPHHALPVVMSLYTVILVILLLEGPRRHLMLCLYLIVSAVMSTVDVIEMSEVFGLINSVNRVIALYLAFALVILSVWAFKSMFLHISKELYESSVKDNLTGAYNSRMMEKTIEIMTEAYIDSKCVYSVAMADLDNFKLVNDRFGHDVGDQVLCDFVSIAKGYVRENDMISRYGGDEFVFLFADCNSEEAVEIMNRILAETYHLNEEFGEVDLSFSAGVCDCLEAEASNVDILKLADQLMYKAKRRGKNSVIFSDELVS